MIGYSLWKSPEMLTIICTSWMFFTVCRFLAELSSMKCESESKSPTLSSGLTDPW